MSQERRLMRRLRAGSGQLMSPGGIYLPQCAHTPEMEQDERRTRLAEQILLEMVETVEWSENEGGEKATQEDANSAMRVAARAALAGAEVIYPEFPEVGALGQKLPPAAQEGARAVSGLPSPGAEFLGAAVDADLGDPRRDPALSAPWTGEEPPEPAPPVIDLMEALKACPARAGIPMAKVLPGSDEPPPRGEG